MELHVTLARSRRLGADLYAQLKDAILDGRLAADDALPATRELAERLEVSRNTVSGAYDRLIAEGFLVARVGAGTFVAVDVARRGRRAPAGTLKPRRDWRPSVAAAERATVAFDFQLGAPDPALFPWDTWRGLVSKQLRRRRREVGYAPPEGDPGLRDAIARHVGVSRSVQAGADDVVVTSGAQQAFDLIGRVLIAPGACVAVEDPGYPPLRHAWRALGARVVGVRVDREGLDVARLPDDARVVYVTPSHQFPLGTAMSLARRMALIAWAERHDAAIVEDDYDSEFRFDGRPLEPLQSLDDRGRVLYVGTFSKVLLPALRVGFVIAPASLTPALRAAKQLTDSHGALDVQRALAALIDDGELARHVRRVLRAYRERRERLLEALARQPLELIPTSAGLHVAVRFRDRRLRGEAVARAALDDGVYVEPLSRYGRRSEGLALGYGVIAANKIDEGVKRLARQL